MSKSQVNKGGLFLASVLTLLLLVAPATAAPFEKPEAGSRYKVQDVKNRAVEKTGFFNRFSNDRVALIEEDTYNKLSYLVDKNLKVTYQGQPYDQDKLLIHSIVRLVIVDGIVIEIILLQESS